MTQMAPGAPQRLLRLEGFEPAVALSDAERDDFCRRFSVFIADGSGARRGGLGDILRAATPSGEVVAVKRLRRDDAASPDARAALVAAFDAEYDAHRALSGLRGIPRLFGRGTIDGESAMVMEWVSGATLEEAARLLAVDDAGRLSPLTAARIGRDLFDVLASMGYLGDGLAHRDLSLRNVMVDTSRITLADQVEEGSFDLRFVDFGSAVVVADDDPSVTARFGGARGATADFAAPEMLTEDVAAVERLRRSPAVDVYAAGSVLYALLEGRPPYDLSVAGRAERATNSAYRIKTEFSPEPLSGAHGAAGDLAAVLAREPEVAVIVGRAAADLDAAPSASRLRLALSQVDGQLESLVAACLQPQQQARPTAAQMRDALAAFCANYADNVGRALRGEPLATCAVGEDEQRRRRRSRRVRRVARACLVAVAAALWLYVAVFTGLLVNGIPVAFPAGGALYEGPAPGAVVSAVLLVPGVLGALARGRKGSTTLGLGRGLLGDAVGCLLAGLVISLTAWPAPGVIDALFAALFPAGAAPVVAFVADCLLAAPTAAAKKDLSPAPKRPVLPWHASDASLEALGLLPAPSAAALPEGGFGDVELVVEEIYELPEERP